MAKTTLFAYDHASGRWRKNGKWSKPPRKSQLRTDSRGNAIDANGRRIPLAAMAGPAPKPVKAKAKPKAKPTAKPKAKAKAKQAKPKAKPKKLPSKPKTKKPAKKPKAVTRPRRRKPKPKEKRGTPVKRVSKLRQKAFEALPVITPGKKRFSTRLPVRGEVLHVPAGEVITQRALISSRFDNARDPEHAGDVLFANIARMAKKTSLEPDDIVIYQYGIELVNTSASGRFDDTEKLVRQMSKEYPEFSYKFNEDSVHISLGKDDEPSSRGKAMRALEAHREKLVDIWAYFSDLWDGDIGWFTWADNDEIEGGSG